VANEAVRMAAKEVSDSGQFLGGRTVEVVNGDSTCTDAAAATASAEALVSQAVAGIVGSDCSGTTAAILANVAVPNGIGMISPSSTSPALSTAEDNDLFFRTAPSDSLGGQIMSDILIDRGITDVAITYTNNDYGKGFADSFTTAYAAAGGTVSITAPHEDGKSDYSAEVASLAAAGSDVLLVVGYIDQGGRAIIQNALDTGAFDTFALSDAMIGPALFDYIGRRACHLVRPVSGQRSRRPGCSRRSSPQRAAIRVSFTAEAYDAAALMLLVHAGRDSTASSDWTPASWTSPTPGRADPSRRARQGSRTPRRRDRHRLRRRHGRRAHRLRASPPATTVRWSSGTARSRRSASADHEIGC
jgi:branched-chain amino acid transport system substrate-binding protein